MDIHKIINDFYSEDFRAGVIELIVYSMDRDYLLESQQKYDKIIIGSYQVRCSVLAEMNANKPIKKYGLKIQFDKL